MESGNGNGTSSGNAIFEYFCEMNVLGTIINIATGAAFSDIEDICNNNANYNANDNDNNDDDALTYSEMGKMGLASTSHENGNANGSTTDKKAPRHIVRILPLTSIAIQAIQSVSILVQNVSIVTSLYFILSNQKMNDLINLSLEQYSIAEQHRDDAAARNANRKSTSNGSKQQLRQSTTAAQSQSAEMSEITTLFVSFLKSLAMRMNPETLQFYISYPISRS